MHVSHFNITWLRAHTQRFIHLLLLAALFQALLPMLLQPRAVQDTDGNTLFICTLQGLQTLPADGDSPHASLSNPCPACALTHAGAAALPSNQPQLTQSLSVVSYQLPQYRVTPRSAPAYFKAPSRAPPVA